VKILLFVVLFFVVYAKCIDPWVFEFVVSNIIGNNQWGKKNHEN